MVTELVLIGKLLGVEEGADATEYALIAALISIAIIGGATIWGQNLVGGFFTALGAFVGAKETL